MVSRPVAPRTYLFLQGPPGPFFQRLGGALKASGHGVHRINFNGGDCADWPQGSVNFRGQAQNWPHFFDNYVVDHGITDLILFGDCRPLHRAAHGMAKLRKLRIHVFEEGYIRPDWVTMELDGVNGHSTLSRDPHWYLEQARHCPHRRSLPHIPADAGRRFREAFTYYRRVATGAWRFPHYESHRPEPALLEAAGWAFRFASRRAAARRSDRVLAELAGLNHFLLPLQLNSDHQIRVHSPFANMKVAAEYVLASFARTAPHATHLVIKQHPLDNGLVRWRRLVEARARHYGIADRVHFIEGGEIGEMVSRARGVVTVNSTTGTLALSAGIPVKVLGRAIYDIDGITDQKILDDFWRNPEPPCADIYEAFTRTLTDRCLIRGGFASEEGLQLLIAAASARLTAAPLAAETVEPLIREAAE